MSPWEEPYEPEDDDIPAVRPEPDEITLAVGGTWYAQSYIVDECRETFHGSAFSRYPEKFDRFYVHSSVGALLVDVLVGDGDQQDLQSARKNVSFKRAWCAEHDRRYLVVRESEMTVAEIRALLVGEPTPEPAVASSLDKPARKRGGVQRPKATA